MYKTFVFIIIIIMKHTLLSIVVVVLSHALVPHKDIVQEID